MLELSKVSQIMPNNNEGTYGGMTSVESIFSPIYSVIPVLDIRIYNLGKKMKHHTTNKFTLFDFTCCKCT